MRLILSLLVLVSTSEGLVYIYCTYDLIIFVGSLCELGLKKVLLCSQDLEVFCITVLHEELSVPYGSLQVQDLLLIEVHSFLGCLPECEGIVYFHTGIQKALSESVCCLFELRFAMTLPGSTLMLPLPVVHPNAPLRVILG